MTHFFDKKKQLTSFIEIFKHLVIEDRSFFKLMLIFQQKVIGCNVISPNVLCFVRMTMT